MSVKTNQTQGGSGRVAIVTGGGGGVGRSAAIALAGDGWSIVVAGRTQASLDETLALLGSDTESSAVVADVSDPADVDALFASTTARFGSVDLLFNNAGIAAPAVPIDELDVAVWNDVVAVNLTGSFLCARAAFGVMKQQEKGGRIINNGSISATTPRPFSVPYTTTKHAISGLTKCLALDGRAHSISCGQIDIGNASTAMGDQMAAGMLQANGTTLGEPTMSVAHVGNAIAHMASLPPDANVLHMTVMANAMPFVGRG